MTAGTDIVPSFCFASLSGRWMWCLRSMRLMATSPASVMRYLVALGFVLSACSKPFW